MGKADTVLRASALAEVRAVVDNGGEPLRDWQLYQLTVELLLQQAVPDVAQVESCFQQALAIARRWQAKSYELRTAMSLDRLWQ
jgi:hypothetical protein